MYVYLDYDAKSETNDQPMETDMEAKTADNSLTSRDSLSKVCRALSRLDSNQTDLTRSD